VNLVSIAYSQVNLNEIRLWAFHTVQNILENEEEKVWGHDHSERRGSLLHGFQVSNFTF
jgi:hypothetical protein